MAKTSRQTHKHGDSMTESAQCGRFSENLAPKFALKGKTNPNISNLFKIRDKDPHIKLRNIEAFNGINSNTEIN